MKNSEVKYKAIKLRSEGKTFQEINEILDTEIPKSTFSTWFRGIVIPRSFSDKIEKERKMKLIEAQKKGVAILRNKKIKYFQNLLIDNNDLQNLLKNKDIAKVVLATLYLCEGTKNKGRSALVFGNSDPNIIRLFLLLLRYVFKVDENKFRCTLQGREDQKIKKLEMFWSEVTSIPISQFYTARIDSRSKGKVSKKPDYKGVCRVDYLSAGVFHEIMVVGGVLTGNIEHYK
ncbi:hypothetical protein D4R99_02985 [bacterium]|nr:MAG: hypothetical protein D4R99_02985 [bacterium]